MADICARVCLGQGRLRKTGRTWRQQLPMALVALSTDGKFPDSSQFEFNPQIAGTGLACLLERELAEVEWDGKRICTKLGPWRRHDRRYRASAGQCLAENDQIDGERPIDNKDKMRACVRSDRVAAANSRIAGPCTSAWTDGTLRCDDLARRSGRRGLLCLLYGCETSESCSPLAQEGLPAQEWQRVT